MRVASIAIALLVIVRSEGFAPLLPPYIPSESITASVTLPFTTNGIKETITSGTSALPSEKSLLLTANVIAVASAPTVSVPTSAALQQQGTTAPGVFIADINYDGKVPTVESDEFVVVTNGSKAPVDVSGYFLYVATTGNQGATFTFPKDSILKPATSIRIYTNEIHKESGGYSFGSGKALWNNRGGLAVFKDASGKKIGEFKYKPDSTV